MPKRNASRNNHDASIRHHLEEISTHLGALKQLHPKGEKYYTKIGQALKSVYVQHGGHPDA
jgi:hypothetical protein